MATEDALVSTRSRHTPPTAIQEFLNSEVFGGFLLVAASALALLLANSPLAPAYAHLLGIKLGFHLGAWSLSESLLHWTNDGLMAVFFLLVGLEIKREVLAGELSSVRQAALPALAAVGGMVVPALVYLAVCGREPTAVRGWAIPAATDIAFALAALALVGSRLPASLKVFLAALAIIDDLGAILIIAVFYTDSLSLVALGLAAAALGVLVALNRTGVKALWPYLLVGVALWLCVLKSGAHATLAGVALALTIPLRGNGAGAESTAHHPLGPLRHLEHRLHPLVAFGVVPVFGFANAGLSFGGLGWAALLNPLPLAIGAGLFLGKQAGVFGAVWVAARLGWAALPEGATLRMLYGVALLCGIGFTMSLFIGSLAFDDPRFAAEVKFGVFAGSLLSALAGMAWLWLSGRGATGINTQVGGVGAGESPVISD